MKNNYKRSIVVHGSVKTIMVKKKNTIIRGSDKCYCFRAAVSVPVLAGSTPAPVPALVDGVGLHDAPSHFASPDLAHAAPASLAEAPPVLVTLADPTPLLVRVALWTHAAAAPPDCFAGFDLVGCFHGNICFHSGVLVPVDST